MCFQISIHTLLYVLLNCFLELLPLWFSRTNVNVYQNRIEFFKTIVKIHVQIRCFDKVIQTFHRQFCDFLCFSAPALGRRSFISSPHYHFINYIIVVFIVTSAALCSFLYTITRGKYTRPRKGLNKRTSSCCLLKKDCNSWTI